VSVGFADRFPIILILWLLLFVPAVKAQDVALPPAPTQYVTDTAGFLPPEVVERLNTRLRTYDEQTRRQLIVYIGSTTGDVPIEDWAFRVFEKWGVGRKDLDDGLALFIMAKDRRLRIEVGYGLEGDVTDLRASRIIQEVIVPRIRAGDNGGAVESGVEALIQLIESPQTAGEQGRQAGQEESRQVSPFQFIFIGILAVIILGALATSPGMVAWMLLSVLSGGNRRRGRRGGGYWGGGGGFGGGGWSGGGGWGGGGGGFSGGGGMSGGGGASGSW
jgi:uncharacterized protein